MAGQETILLRRNDEASIHDEFLTPGEYVPYTRNEGYGARAWVGWRCPRCHSTLLLLRSVHTVDYDGDVTPRVGCPQENCGLVAHMRLSDWVPEALGQA